MNTKLAIVCILTAGSALAATSVFLTSSQFGQHEKSSSKEEIGLHQMEPWSADALPSAKNTNTTVVKPDLTPEPQPPDTVNILSVTDLTRDKEKYLGKRVRVEGKVSVHIFYGERPCSIDDSMCDTTTGVQLELWQPQPRAGSENQILLFSKNQPYPCPKISPERYTCSPYRDNQIVTIEGTWSKDQVAVAWRGGSGGGAPTPTKWEDRYFLNII